MNKYDVFDNKGFRMYIGMERNDKIHGYDWGKNGHGFITDTDIKFYQWVVVCTHTE
jgi:hypothetical protein